MLITALQSYWYTSCWCFSFFSFTTKVLVKVLMWFVHRFYSVKPSSLYEFIHPPRSLELSLTEEMKWSSNPPARTLLNVSYRDKEIWLLLDIHRGFYRPEVSKFHFPFVIEHTIGTFPITVVKEKQTLVKYCQWRQHFFAQRNWMVTKSGVLLSRYVMDVTCQRCS